jgi:twinkle protein
MRDYEALAAQIINGDSIMPYTVDDEVQAKVYDGSTFRDELIDSFHMPEQIHGAKLPWGSTHFNIRFRTGETTIWAGINGHGKSQLLGMVSLGWIAQGESVLNISLEMKPLATLKRMAIQACMNDQPTDMILNRFMDFMLGAGYVFNHQGNIEPRLIFGTIRYAASKGIKHIIIDSLMKCVKGVDDYNAQKDFVNQITQLAQQYNVHIHLVHHIRKQENEYKIPNKFDLAGSGAMTDLADQIIVVYRNKQKERTLEKDPANQDAQAMPDAVLAVDKNRHGEWEGRIPLWYNIQAKQYLSDSKKRPLDLMDKATYEFRR